MPVGTRWLRAAGSAPASGTSLVQGGWARRPGTHVAVYVVVDRHRAHERDLGRPHGVVVTEPELQLVLIACVESVGRPLQIDEPAPHVVG
jgi:hypothetical protein